MLVWRIATDTPNYLADDLSGAGAKSSGGRWNLAGEAVLYASETQALACLETVVHLNGARLPLNRYLVSIDIPADVWAARETLTPADLPVGWDAEPFGRVSLQVGSLWIRSLSSAILRVPSVIVPAEFNVLINPLHPGSVGIRAVKLSKWLYDQRQSSG